MLYQGLRLSRMRSAGILLSAILLVCLSTPVHAIDPGDIAAPSMNVPDMSMPKPLVSKPNMDMPVAKPKPLVKPGSGLSPSLNHTASTLSNKTQQDAQQVDVSGKWSIKFEDGANSSLALTLWSSADTITVMGFGILTEGGIDNPVTATGSATARELRLIIKSATSKYINKIYDECDLNLLLSNNTAKGTYALMSGGQLSSAGNATAVKQ